MNIRIKAKKIVDDLLKNRIFRRIVQIVLTLVAGLIGFLGLYFVRTLFVDVLHQIKEGGDYIYSPQIGYGFLGGALSFLGVFVFGFYGAILSKEMPPILVEIFGYLVFFGIIFMIIGPGIIEFFIRGHLLDRGYQVCPLKLVHNLGYNSQIYAKEGCDCEDYRRK